MRRSVGLLLALVCYLPSVQGQDKPVGLRIFYTGHSFHMFVPPRIDQLAAALPIPDHRNAGKQGIGGSRVIQHWELHDGDNSARQALTKGDVDVFTMAAHLIVPDPGITNFVKLGLEHNPKLRLYVQASWLPYDLTSLENATRGPIDREQTDLTALQKATNDWRGKLEKQVDELNAGRPAPAVFVIPVGDAVNELRRQIKVGMFPGLTKQTELFRDPIGHGNGHVQSLASHCVFAAIYRRSPEGLTLKETGVTDEQQTRLQKIAWDAIASYDHAGIVKKP